MPGPRARTLVTTGCEARFPIEQPKAARVLGIDRGKIWVPPDAFDPLTGEDLAAWNRALFPEAPKR
jgi:hypothetical protein